MYRALRSMRVQKADGTSEWRQPGDAVPEAATWRNVAVWIKQGRIIEDTPGTAAAQGRITRKPNVVADVDNRPQSPVPKPHEPLPNLPPHKLEVVKEAPPAPPSQEALDMQEQLRKLKREQLNILAADAGIDGAENMGKKDEVIQAILAAQD